MDETVSQAIQFRLSGQDGLTAEAAAAEILDNPLYSAVTGFDVRPIFLVRDRHGSLIDHVTADGQPSLWEVVALATFTDGDRDVIGAMYTATEAEAKNIARQWTAELA